MGDRTLGRIVSVGVYLRTMTAFALVWWGIAWWTGNAMLLPGPDRVASALVSVTTDGDLFFHTALSLARLSLSLAIASAIAVPLGLAMGTSTTIEHIVDPVVEILRPISGIAWIPLALFIFGIGHGLPIFIMAYTAAFPILVGTIAGAKFVDRKLVDSARVMGLDRTMIIRRVIVPALDTEAAVRVYGLRLQTQMPHYGNPALHQTLNYIFMPVHALHFDGTRARRHHLGCRVQGRPHPAPRR